jgi:7,8-dihydropterin-6-yl-methyl-4-(beta-D-ribofuranosyl)aminobenzene 5'-phosphate synthase
MKFQFFLFLATVIVVLSYLTTGCQQAERCPSEVPLTGFATLTSSRSELLLKEKTAMPETPAQKSGPATTISETEKIAPEVSVITPLSKGPLTVTILFDNNPYDKRLRTSWGFAALVEHQNQSLLFDTGGDGLILLENMRILGIDPSRIQGVMLSHAHNDHTGGLVHLLESGARPAIYVFPRFGGNVDQETAKITAVLQVEAGDSISQGMYTTGAMGGSIREQALVISTSKGLVIVTGCAHPGIVQIVEKAKGMVNEPIYLVMGGFHLGDKSDHRLNEIINAFHNLAIQKVAPCHCTGNKAIARFKAEYGEDFIRAGVGSVIVVEE